MGGILEKPITDKESSVAEGNGMKATIVNMQGWRSNMEDAHIMKLAMDNFPDCSFFGVYDGHGGEFVAKYTEKHLLDLLTQNLYKVNQKDANSIRLALERTYLDHDNNLSSQDEINKGDKSGCTAVSVYMNKDYIICANAGDSRAVLYSDHKVVELSHDHKPYNPEESKRITDAGGCVVMKRVNGDLAVSRAFGDFSLKNNTSLPPQQQAVSAFPDIEIVKRSPKDDFIVLACDGIWDVIDNEKLCEKVVQELECEENLEDVAKNILDHCLDEGSKDNMSIIIVLIDQRQRTIPEKVEERRKFKIEQKKKMEEEAKLKEENDRLDNMSNNNSNGKLMESDDYYEDDSTPDRNHTN